MSTPESNHPDPPRARTLADAKASGALRAFDGIVCFGGEDWWNHNRGHFDMRIMRAFADEVPVLYVNSLGMRIPRAGSGAMFTRRVARKLRSLRQGLVEVDERFSVMTAPMIPGAGAPLTRRFAAASVRRALRRMGIERPLAWVACPTALDLLPSIPHVGLTYQRTDRYEDFRGVDVDAIVARDRTLKSTSDLVVYCSSALMDAERKDPGTHVLVDHGVDAEVFIAADAANDVPEDIADIPEPRIGFVGTLDNQTLDLELLVDVARRMPNARFVLVGASTLPSGWCPLSNVHHLGRRPVEDVARYMAACDVLIMPWRRNGRVDACNPVKLKEYLAAGRPIVSTPFRELDRYCGLVRTAENGEQFAAEITRALEEPFDAVPGRTHVAGSTWTEQALTLRRALATAGLRATTGTLAAPAAIVESRPIEDAPEASAMSEAIADLVQAIADGPQNLGTAPGDPARLVAGRPTDTLNRETDVDGASHSEPITSEAAEGTDRDGRDGADVGPGQLRLVLPDIGPAHVAELPTGDLPIDFAVVLAGGLRPSPLLAVLDRSPIDLWIRPDESVLDTWIDRIRDATAGRQRPLPVRIAVNNAVPAAWPRETEGVTVERDPGVYRGPAGVVRDLSRHLPADRHILVVESARYLDGSLTSIIADHLAADASVTVGRNPDGSPAGVYVIRRDALDVVPPAGYCDLKEQMLPRVQAAGGLVLIHRLEGRGAMPLRTRDQLISAAHIARQRTVRPGLGAIDHPGAPIRVVCRGAMVGPDACIFDSIVMPGAYVGPRSTVVRSIVGPETVVPPDVDLVDCVLHAGRMLADEQEGFRAA